MSNEEPVKSIVTSYRLREDTKEKLQQQLKQLGLTQEQYFNRVANLMELESVKQNSFLSKDTTTLQSNLDSILEAFISIADGSNNLISNKDAELEALKSKYKNMLAEKENTITEQNERLQQIYSDNNVLQIESNNNKDELVKAKADNEKQMEQLKGGLKDKDIIVEAYKAKNDMLLSDLADYKQYKIEVEQYKQLLADAQNKNIELNDSSKDKDSTIKDLVKSQEKLIIEHEKELESLKKENELNIKVAVSEIKEALNSKLNEQQQIHIDAIEDYQAKYRTLLEALEKGKTVVKPETTTVKEYVTSVKGTKPV